MLFLFFAYLFVLLRVKEQGYEAFKAQPIEASEQ